MTAWLKAWNAAGQTALSSWEYFGKLASDAAWTRGASEEWQRAQKLRLMRR
jgi:hypothetical protein